MSISDDDFARLVERVNSLESRFDRIDRALVDADRKLDALNEKLDDYAAEARAQLREILRRLPPQ